MNISSINPMATQPDPYSGASPADVAQRQQVVQALHTLNQGNIFGENRELTFTLDRISHKMVIRVIDRDTRETVAQLPPEYVLRLAATLQKGL
jgi:uncharacterized FlaG/YvyC family protein